MNLIDGCNYTLNNRYGTKLGIRHLWDFIKTWGFRKDVKWSSPYFVFLHRNNDADNDNNEEDGNTNDYDAENKDTKGYCFGKRLFVIF